MKINSWIQAENSEKVSPILQCYWAIYYINGTPNDLGLIKLVLLMALSLFFCLAEMTWTQNHLDPYRGDIFTLFVSEYLLSVYANNVYFINEHSVLLVKQNWKFWVDWNSGYPEYIHFFALQYWLFRNSIPDINY